MAVIGQGRFVKPDVVVSHFHLRDGDQVADFGAGAGYFARALSRAVGSGGRVFACDIQRGMVDKLGALKREERLTNLEPLWCDLEAAGSVKIRDGALDTGVLVNTLFQIEDRNTALTEVARTIRSGGKLFVIDWSESFGGMGPSPDAVLDEETARSTVEAAGFTFERTFDAGEHHYGLAFRRV